MPFKYKILLKKNNSLYYIIAGEASGDLHGANLMRAIQKKHPQVSFRGLGGPLMKERGLVCHTNFNRLAVMGFAEIIKDLRFFMSLKSAVIQDVLKSLPIKIILIDYPGFNLRIAQKIKSLYSAPIIYYISPQLWAWKENRIKIIKQNVDSLIVLFPFEKHWFNKRELNVEYFGHPLIDIYKKTKLKPENPKNTIGLFPGSRIQEIQRHLPIFINIIKSVLIINPTAQFVVSVSKHAPSALFGEISKLSSVLLDNEESFTVFNKVNVGIVASGTATLECAISKTPFVVIYKTSFLSWLIAKTVLSIPFISIVNILANREVVKEFLQYKINVKTIALHINRLLKNSKKTTEALNGVVKGLGDGRSYLKTAEHIEGMK